MNLYFALKLVHVLGGAVLFGTGLGIAFFLWMAHRTRDPAAIAHTARIVIIADVVFTATAVVVQPLSGAAIAWYAGYSLVGALDRALAGALCVRRRLLAAGGVDLDRAAATCGCRGPRRN